jgi:hypothetical protein
VTGQTLRVLPQRRCQRFGTEVDHAGERTAPGLHVRASRAVARLALKSAVAEGPARVIRLRVLGVEDPGDRRVVMATQAGVGSLRAIGRTRLRAEGWIVGWAGWLSGRPSRYGTEAPAQ